MTQIRQYDGLKTITKNIKTFRRRQVENFSPEIFFRNNEKGVWYDPSDFSTMFQDSAGTTPVTADGQPVGKILDKSGRGFHATQATATSRPILGLENGRYYLTFDGVDDGLSTAAIDFTATDKMTVWAGVRKLSDVTAVISELSAASGSNSGSFYLVSGLDNGAAGSGNGYTSTARGTAAPTSAQTAQYLIAAPDTSVISATHDISGDNSTIRRNGVIGSSSGADKGTGNFGNYPLYIGRRGGTTLPFNGRMYGLIVRGAASNDAQVAHGELYINQNTGAF